jgi:hypothetical protein
MRHGFNKSLAVGTLLLAIAGCSTGGYGGPETGQQPSAAATRTNPRLSPEALNAYLDRYACESETALQTRIDALKAFFEERKGNTQRFADSMLGIEGKVMLSGSAVADLMQAVANGGAPKNSSIEKFVRDRFRADVLDAADAKRAVDEAVSGFLGDIEAIESRMLVELQADVGDADLALPKSLSKPVGLGGIHYESMINDTMNGATSDLAISVGMYFVSNYLSSKATNNITSEDTNGLWKAIVGSGLGVLTDMAIERLAKDAGYDPEKSLSKRVESGIDRVRESLIDGDPEVAKFYQTLKDLRRMHPDAAVREACGRADEAVRQAANLGLREQMRNLRNDRCRRLWTVLTERFIGAEAAKSPFLMYPPMDPASTSPADYIIRWADNITSAFGGK